MKYLLMFCASPDAQAEQDKLTTEERERRFAHLGQWFAQYKDRLGGSNRLQSAYTATTVSFDANGKPVVKDGPFMEGKEVIGGYCEIDVANLDEALQMAKTWPAGGSIEIRPIAERTAGVTAPARA